VWPFLFLIDARSEACLAPPAENHRFSSFIGSPQCGSKPRFTQLGCAHQAPPKKKPPDRVAFLIGSSGPRVVSLGRSTGVERCSPKPRSHPTGLFSSTKSWVCLLQGMFGPSGRKSQIFVVHRLAAVRLETPIHPTGLFSPSTAPRAETKKGRPMDDPSLFGSACWARTSDPMINSHLLYQLS
jgi:hypothetical protein